MPAKSPYHLVAWSAGPLMISGVRASSIEDRVDLVDDREVVAALDELVLGPRHVVAQVVEAELVVRAVGDVARRTARGAPSGVILARMHADLEAEEAVHAAHQLGVALGEVVVDRDDVHALAGERVEVRRQRCRPGSCPHRSSSRRCCRGAGRRRPSSGRRSAAGRGCAWRPRGPSRTPREQVVEALAVGAARPGTRRSAPAARRRTSRRSPPRWR